MNFDRLRFVAERAELGEAREALFGVTIPERPGAFREFCSAIGRRVVTEFNYRLSGREEAHIFVGIATRSRQDAAELAETFEQGGYRTIDPDRRRGRQAARAAHGRRPKPRRRQRAAVPLRVPRAARRADGVSRAARRPLEHQPVSLPQSRRRLRPRAGRLRGAGRARWAASRRFSNGSATAISASAPTSPTSCSWDRGESSKFGRKFVAQGFRPASIYSRRNALRQTCCGRLMLVCEHADAANARRDPSLDLAEPSGSSREGSRCDGLPA